MGVVTGGGDGFTPAGATMGITASQSVVADQGVVPFDVAIQDPHGFIDAAHHQLVVPAGLGGLYLYGVSLVFSGATGLVALTVFGNSSVADNVQATAANPGNTNSGGVVCMGLEHFGAGDTLASVIRLNGVATTVVMGSSNGSQLWMLRVTG